ncbi:acid sphingomyelinase-like phosphodiesterase 3b isoform X2 [Eurytemora carolleeae]|uniref:acid sphingomyelinase-like phosphodiesterase 3b isoform X2 n=1 Tax=Eurytemora carolleeae TaxID=1294199 RepID=UPI000C76D536|nr:acid sphingomyelinase-like phosphodiesterase 3b isoform X2 [Eurytemora carolleeae]|eukprot:XP_023342932.1 acid sphingomyelinase-like phosphodiesterase 3b isoform X2 [Eurytemora affinis]
MRLGGSLIIFLHFTSSVRYDAVKQQTGYFWQLDSLNLNLNYSMLGDRNKNCEYYPGTPVYQRPSGPFGDYSCDSPIDLIRSATAFMKTIRGEEFDFLLWTGDSGPNTGNPTNAKVQMYIDEMTQLLREEFPYSSIYPVLGDRDTFHHKPDTTQGGQKDTSPNQSPLGDASALDTELYRYVSEIWNTWLPPSAVQTLKKGGYYKVELAGRRLNLVGLNTGLWLKDTERGRYTGGDPGLQFSWLEQVLQKAREKQQTVIIFGHTPPGVFEIGSHNQAQYWYHPVYNSRYNRLVLQYSDVIVGQFFGHQNTDTFRIFRDGKRNPVSWALISPAVSPRTVLNGEPDLVVSSPSLRLYRYSTYDGKILDYSQFTLSLDDSNSGGVPQWKLQYNFSSQYSNIGGISPESLDLLYTKLQSNTRPDLLDNYLVSNSQLAPLTCGASCQQAHFCSISNIDFNNYRQCMMISSTGRNLFLSHHCVFLFLVLFHQFFSFGCSYLDNV